jgi:ferredoxin
MTAPAGEIDDQVSGTESEKMRKDYWHGPGRARKTGFTSRTRREFAGIGSDLSGPTKDRELQLLRLRSEIISRRLDVLGQRMRGEAAITRQAIAAVVDDEECTGCGLCREVCPVDAISMNEVARVDSSKCTACLACVRQCPQGAIAVKYQERRTDIFPHHLT